MKKYIIALFAILTLVTSCNVKEFLTEDPVMSQSTELTLSDYNGLNKAVAGAYSPLASSTWYGNFFVLDAEMRAGNAMIPINTNFQSGRMSVPYHMTYEPSSTSGLWGTAYFLISACNNVINAIDNNAENPAGDNNQNRRYRCKHAEIQHRETEDDTENILDAGYPVPG